MAILFNFFLDFWGLCPLMFMAVLLVSTLLAFCVKRSHVLILLLLLELNLVSLLVGFSSFSAGSSWLTWSMVVVGVCESAMGMALLVLYAGSYGSDRVLG